MNTPVLLTCCEYTDLLRSMERYDALAWDLPALPEALLLALSKAEKKWKARLGFFNRWTFKPLKKAFENAFAGLQIRVFSKKMPAPAYYVYKEGRPFKKTGIYLHKSLFNRDFPTFLLLFIHELSHFILSNGADSAAIFQTTAEFKKTLPAYTSAEEQRPFFSLYPTEVYAVSVQHTLLKSLFPHLTEKTVNALKVQLERENDALLKAVASFLEKKA